MNPSSPEIARTLGKTVRALRKASFDLTTQISKELDAEEKDPSSQPSASNSDRTTKSSAVDTVERQDGEVTNQGD